jgi:hypothetical protein
MASLAAILATALVFSNAQAADALFMLDDLPKAKLAKQEALKAQKKLEEQKKAEQTLKMGFKWNIATKGPQVVCGDKLCSDSKLKPIPVLKSLKEEQMKIVKKTIEQQKAAKIIKTEYRLG